MAISLAKGQRISLEKGGKGLEKMCVGVNWGAIEKKSLFGKIKKEAVDLDASVGLFSENKQLIDTVYFGQLGSKCGSIRHSGDDLTGDIDGDDGLDNEVIVVDLTRIPKTVSQVVFVLNSFQGQDFAAIPTASIRIYEGTPDRVDDIIATFDIANDATFAGKVSMIMGKLYRHGDSWKFTSIGDSTPDRKLEQTLQTVSAKYL
ncbi:MAG: TerD family protein [Methylococcaceae bacterium]|nr:TerD family protein [Methylococcaceae bacterium]